MADSDSEYRESSIDHETARSRARKLRHVSPIIQPRTSIVRAQGKQQREEPAGPPPRKRARTSFNATYLDLLNQDIRDASAGRIHDEHTTSQSVRPDDTTQIGEVVWSVAEKDAFFAAVSRLGKDDVAGISARIGTKSEPEVRQFSMLLDAAERRQGDGEGRGTQRARLLPTDFPAAVEIGDECNAALETAADGLALRQEAYEEEFERKRWGSPWLITAPLAQTLEDVFLDRQEEEEREEKRAQSTRRGKARLKAGVNDEVDGPRENSRRSGDRMKQRDVDVSLDELPFAQLFSVQNWLRLSDRVFMNSAVSDSNWHALSTAEPPEPPAIRATAFADFHGLALSVTRRLMLAAMYVAESRIRAQSLNASLRRAQRRVKVKDVEAAVASLGMMHDRRAFWARCARRLRLNIIDDGTEEDGDRTDQEDVEISTGGSSDTDADVEDATVSRSGHETDDAESEAGESEEENRETMSYDEVEAALGCPAVDNTHSSPQTDESDAANTVEYVSSNDESDSDNEDIEMKGVRNIPKIIKPEPDPEDTEMDDREETLDPDHESNEGLDQATMAQEIEEAMLYLAPREYNIMQATPDQRAIKSRIRAEHRMERNVEWLDLKASTEAEAGLWAVLRGQSDSRTEGSKDSLTRAEVELTARTERIRAGTSCV
ncbi:hypothetical protein GGR50DRAFT_260462 [Xylaria sp. CBS 124048]|nr:hypothetical protein GGR50DRAFT_260462 [Xylaria sp. CBS 124048]